MSGKPMFRHVTEIDKRVFSARATEKVNLQVVRFKLAEATT